MAVRPSAPGTLRMTKLGWPGRYLLRLLPSKRPTTSVPPPAGGARRPTASKARPAALSRWIACMASAHTFGHRLQRFVVDEHVRFHEDRQQHTAIGRPGAMAAPGGAPDILAGLAFALLVAQAAFEHVGLFDVEMLVQWQRRTRCPPADCGGEAALLVLEQDFPGDAFEIAFRPRQRVDVDIARAQGAEGILPRKVRRSCGHDRHSSRLGRSSAYPLPLRSD